MRPEEDLLSAEHLEEEREGSEVEVDPGVGSAVEEGVNELPWVAFDVLYCFAGGGSVRYGIIFR